MSDPAGEHDTLRRAVADNHRAWFAATARAAMVFPPDGALDVDALLAAARTRGCRELGCWSLDENPVLGARLVARGFRWGWRPHWMARPLDGPLPGPAEARFAVIGAAPPYARTLPYAPADPVPDGAVALGVRLREKLVGQVTVLPRGEVAGVYNMGVVPRVRRRGIGMALVRAACLLARDAGCRYVVLNGTEEGTRLYERAGFDSLGRGQTWWWSGAAAPAPRELALAEAIGLGDVAKLRTLRPTSAELHRPLTGGESPLRLAVLCDRPAVVEWLLATEPALCNARIGPHGETVLHAAVEHDRAGIVECALAAGADPGKRDTTFRATALGWAEHFGRVTLAQRLMSAAWQTRER